MVPCKQRVAASAFAAWFATAKCKRFSTFYPLAEDISTSDWKDRFKETRPHAHRLSV